MNLKRNKENVSYFNIFNEDFVLLIACKYIAFSKNTHNDYLSTHLKDF